MAGDEEAELQSYCTDHPADCSAVDTSMPFAASIQYFICPHGVLTLAHLDEHGNLLSQLALPPLGASRLVGDLAGAIAQYNRENGVASDGRSQG